MTPHPAPPRTHPEVLARYRELLAAHQATHARLSTRASRVLQLLAADAIAIVYVTLNTLHQSGHAWPLALLFVALAVLIRESLRLQPLASRQQRLLTFYTAAIRRADPAAEPAPEPTAEPAPQPGIDLRQPNHLYERDLDLLGADSLFATLATVRTGPGERGLASYLLNPATHAETLLRQEAVRELLPPTELREEIALLGATRFHQISASFFDDWLDDEPPTFHPAFRIVLLATAIASTAMLLAGLLHFAPWSILRPNLALALILQAAICAYLRKRVIPLLQGGARLELNVKLLADGLALMQRATFTCPKLIALQQASLTPAGAVPALKRLISSLTIVEQRTKEYFYVLSLLFAAGTQTAISIAVWKRRYAPAMRLWLEAWAEFEALNAIATYAFEHPEDVWPELMPPTHAPLFEATGLGHPLLAGSITNDVSLGTEQKFFLISGSNMSGKSTLLRSIGINAVLAYAGAPVRAASLRLTPFRLGASLALTDSLAEGRSKFRAEVDRLSSIVRLSDTTPVLFLVDEIFSGTNSADRRTAAQAVLTRLLTNHAIGALSTHDLALTELATDRNGGTNVHMASPNPEDPLAFDYKLKPGINTQTNALAIIRMLGL